ncbi:MAG: twin-arginine translocase subunit TatC [Pirellulaceae bacterium]|nr:twin-arginine translocase subunit TatC [Pirellulaceae bacterium]
MERLARPKDDLFENSTMTFGEHLEELRSCLVKAIIWLGIGLAFGLIFANQVVKFVSDPLKVAIQDFNAERDLALLGYTDKDDPDYQRMKPFLKNGGLVWEIIYEIPEKYQNLSMESLERRQSMDDADTQTAENADLAPLIVKPREMADLLKQLPDPSSLKPKLQLRESKKGLSSFKMEEGFMIWIKAGLIVGAVFASPMIFFHLWSFVAAGLHQHERKYVYIYLPVSVTLFVAGVILAFFLVLHYVLNFLLAFNGSMDVTIEPRLTYYINFVLLLPLGFGLAFQLPLVMLFLQRIGLIETESYIESWKVAVLVIFILSMLLTPADVPSMIALAIPLMLLYFLGIMMCKFIPRGRGLGSAAYDPA